MDFLGRFAESQSAKTLMSLDWIQREASPDMDLGCLFEAYLRRIPNLTGFDVELKSMFPEHVKLLRRFFIVVREEDSGCRVACCSESIPYELWTSHLKNKKSSVLGRCVMN